MDRFSRRQLLTASVAMCGIACADRPTSGRPNILLAYSDDQSYPHASALGDPVVETPAFDRIAREGVVLAHSYTACPSCTPSRSALLTGRPIWRIGEGGVLYGTLHPEYPLFTHVLEDAGYHTGFVGKPWAPGDWRAGGLTRHPFGREYGNRLELGSAPRDRYERLRRELRGFPGGPARRRPVLLLFRSNRAAPRLRAGDRRAERAGPGQRRGPAVLAGCAGGSL